MEEGLDRDNFYMTLFEAAAQCPAAERETYLRNACARDPDLVGELLDRLEWQDRMGDFLMEPLIARLEGDHPFQAGDLVGGRFRIVREIAEGGMGVVYEAIDEKLEQRRALKCAKPGHYRRLFPEARSALKVTHENVCRVYEIHTAAFAGGPVDFLAMEYLEGETLAARLARGPLPDSAGREIARQLCLGLAAVHHEGVLHRDLKSNNIMLTGDGGGQMRVVITDFGFAREPLLMGDPQAANSSSLRGAPEYIAPELWRGEPATERSDVYALGVILYEIATGQRPFPPDTDWETRLTGRPAPPSGVAARVRRSWNGPILACLEPDPAKRPPGADAVLEKLDAGRSQTRRWLAAMAAIAGLSATAIGLRPAEPPAIRLAVMPLEITGTAEDGGLTGGMVQDFSDRLAHTRISGGSLVVIPLRDTIENAVDSVERARGRLGATHVVKVHAEQKDGQYRVESVITDTRTKVEVSRFSAAYSRSNLARAPAAMAGAVVNALRLKARLPAEGIAAQAYPAYAQGLYYSRRDNRSADLAITELRTAALLDPGSALPHAALAEAYWVKYKNTEVMSWRDQAFSEVGAAESRNPNSAPVRMAAGLMNHAVGWNDRAVDDYRSALERDPSNAEAWLQLGIAYEGMNNRTADAAAAFQKAVDLQPAYYAPHLQLGLFYYRRANYGEAEKQFLRVTQLAPELAQGFSDLGGVYVDMHRFPEAIRALRRSLELGASRGAVMNLGVQLANQGQDAGALEFYEQALAIGPPTYVLFLNLGDSYRRTRQEAKASRAYEQGRELADRALSTDPSSGYTRAFFAYFSARLGEARLAEREISQALQFAPEDRKVLRRAVLTYDCLGLREKALDLLPRATPDLLEELNAHPDLAEFRRQPRFVLMLTQAQTLERRTRNVPGS
jgi:serine/threonine-protein kinase